MSDRSRSKARVLVVIALAALALGPPPAPAAGADAAVACPGFTLVPGQGPSCPVPGGWEITLPDGTSVLTHGPDRVKDVERLDDDALDAASRAPVCIDNPWIEHHNLVIYARPRDAPDRSAWLVPRIRDLVHESNARLHAEAARFGHSADYRFLCADGKVDVRVEVLATTGSQDSFWSIVGDLRNNGYRDHKVKHWVWYDGSVGWGIAGQGTIYGDDRLIADNWNNGPPWAGASFAVTYGYLSSRVMMHENGHNLGAVQNSAPRTSGGFHCNDGRDVMCYADGGWNSRYNHNVCGTERFDCNNDDYFHPDPPAGSYLATHWNLGSTLNRFIRVVPPEANRPPVAAALVSCVALECEFDASPSQDPDGPIASYSWSWGDGTPNGAGARATHAYATAGTRVAELRVVDEWGASDTHRFDVTTYDDHLPPRTTLALDGALGNGSWYRSDVTAHLAAVDDESGVAATRFALDDGEFANYVAPLRLSDGRHDLTYWSEDRAGNVEAAAFVSFGVDTRPPTTTHALSGAAGTAGWHRSAVDVSLDASDATSGVAATRYRVDGGAWAEYAEPFTIDAEGWHTVEYASVDGAGNEEAVREAAFGVDVTPPTAEGLAPGGSVFVNGARRMDATVARDVAVALDVGPPPWRIPVAASASDAESGVLDVVAYAGPTGTSPACEAARLDDVAFACDWWRGATDRGVQRLRVVVRDLAHNEAVVEVTVLV